MKSIKTLQAVFMLFVAASCNRQPNEMWDDTKSCGRHISRGFMTLAGRPASSRMIQNKDDFIQWNESALSEGYYQESDFQAIPGYNEVAVADYVNSQPRETPGDANSTIPGIDAFRDPTVMSGLKGIFRNISYEYNSNLIKGKENNEIVEAVSSYMQSHPNTYVFVEGHCDEHGPEAYNLALGTRRSNAVRNALVQLGVNPDHIFTISYGKERPLVMESNEDAWAKNRRAEFKIYQK